LVNENFYIFNQTAGVNNLILDASTGAATFSNTLTTGASIISGDSVILSGELYWGGTNRTRAYTTGASGSATLNYAFWDGSSWNIKSTLSSTGAATFSSSVTAVQASIGYTSAAPTNGMIVNGDVGIGTTAPSDTIGYGKALDIQSSTGAVVYLRDSDAPTSQYGFIAYDGNDNGLKVNNENSSGFIRFNTAGSERMRITSGGFTKASTNGTYFGPSSSYHEIVNNNNVSGDRCLVIGNNAGSNTNNTSSFTFVVADAGNDRLYIYGNGNVVNQNNSYGSLSDIKLKENIEDASPKLEDLLKVKVRNYNLIGEDTKQIGVIAQEIEEVFPAMVDESEDFEEVEVPQLDEEGNEVLNEEGEVVTTKERVSKGTTTKSVKYSVFVPMLIKAIQELKAEIDILKQKQS
jgi:hypothetical protein